MHFIEYPEFVHTLLTKIADYNIALAKHGFEVFVRFFMLDS